MLFKGMQVADYCKPEVAECAHKELNASGLARAFEAAILHWNCTSISGLFVLYST